MHMKNVTQLRVHLSRFILKLRKYSIQGWLRFFRLKIQRKKVVVVGSCSMCGKCCQRISLEAGGRWLRRESDFERVLMNNPEYQRFTIVGRDSQGFLLFSCSWFTTAGICREHNNRLDICRSYPDRDLYFIGGRMIKGCGYAFQEIVPFSTILEQELNATEESRSPDTCD